MADQKSSSHFEHFTEQTRNVLIFAQEEAVRLQHNYIGTEHLLLGLLREDESVAAKVLTNLGVEFDNTLNIIELVIGRGDGIAFDKMDLTSRCRKVIELAIDEARCLRDHSIGTEHLLLGLVLVGEGGAISVMKSLGIFNLEIIRMQILSIPNLSVPRQLVLGHGRGVEIPRSFRADMRKAQQLERQVQINPQVIVGLIQMYERIIERLEPEENPSFYSTVQNSLGIAYRNLLSEDRFVNLKKAIQCYQQALRFWTPEVGIFAYARIQNNLVPPLANRASVVVS